MTLTQAKLLVTNAGYTLGAGCYEDESFVRAYSKQVTPGTLGYPRFVVEFHKPTKHLQLTGPIEAKKPIVVDMVRRELATNFDCPSDQILGFYGGYLGMTGRQMFDLISEGL